LGTEERKKLFLDPVVQKIIIAIMHSTVKEMKPVFNSVKGYYFKEVDETTGSPEESNRILKILEDNNILNRRFHDKTVVCPSCGSWRIGVHYDCPKCHSSNIDKNQLVEHLRCGLIDSFDKFAKDGKLECPRCKAEVSESIDLKRRGSWLFCSACATRFDEPVVVDQCWDCGQRFAVGEGTLKTVFAYVLNEQVTAEFERSLLLLSPVKTILEGIGYSVEMPASRVGTSGISNEFDLAAWRTNTPEPIMIDAAVDSKPVDKTCVVNMFAKALDVPHQRAIVLAVPKLEDGAMALAKLYKIQVVEGNSIEEASQRLKELLTSPDLAESTQS
jgi:hypothetical protein